MLCLRPGRDTGLLTTVGRDPAISKTEALEESLNLTIDSYDNTDKDKASEQGVQTG